MENSWKNYRFGFDVGAAVLFAAIMLPNIYWFSVPAPNDILRGASVTPTIDTIGSVFQMLMIGLLCILKNTTARKRTRLLWGVAVCHGFYCAAWIAYYRGNVTPAVILSLCLAPCLAFGFYSVGRKNCPAQIFLAGFTNIRTGKFSEVMLIRNGSDFEKFLEEYDISEADVTTEY